MASDIPSPHPQPPRLPLPPGSRIPPSPQAPHVSARQVFLWLPDQAGAVMPFCSSYERTGVPEPGENPPGSPLPALHAGFPPAPDDGVPPPCLFHPIPVTHFLSIDELEDLARNVKLITRADPTNAAHLLSILRNENRSHILYFLARMGALSGMPPQRG